MVVKSLFLLLLNNEGFAGKVSLDPDNWISTIDDELTDTRRKEGPLHMLWVISSLLRFWRWRGHRWSLQWLFTPGLKVKAVPPPSGRKRKSGSGVWFLAALTLTLTWPSCCSVRATPGLSFCFRQPRGATQNVQFHARFQCQHERFFKSLSRERERLLAIISFVHFVGSRFLSRE